MSTHYKENETSLFGFVSLHRIGVSMIDILIHICHWDRYIKFLINCTYYRSCNFRVVKSQPVHCDCQCDVAFWIGSAESNAAAQTPRTGQAVRKEIKLMEWCVCKVVRTRFQRNSKCVNRMYTQIDRQNNINMNTLIKGSQIIGCLTHGRNSFHYSLLRWQYFERIYC